MSRSGLSGVSALATAGAIPPAPVLSARTAIHQNTPRTLDLGPDGYSWAQAKNPLVDSFGKIIAFNQSGARLGPTVSNDAGATWTDLVSDLSTVGFQGPTGEVGGRCSLAHDPVHDKVHGLFVYSVGTDALCYYRRFTLSRDGSNNITGIAKEGAINCILDVQHGGEPGAGSAHPVLFWLQDDATAEPHGKLVGFWGVNEDTGSHVSVTIRASMLVLTNTAADGDVGSWRDLSGGAVVAASSGQKPNVPTTEVWYNDPFPYYGPYQVHPAVLRLPSDAISHPNDFAVLWATRLAEPVRYRRLTYSPANRDWRGSPSAVASGPPLVRAGQNNAGYDLKFELPTEPTYDPAQDRLWFSFGEWFSNAAGDAWSVHAVENGTDAFKSGLPVKVYSSSAALCGSTTFITGDAWFEGGHLLVSYTDLPRKDTYVVVLDGAGAVIAGPILVFSAMPFDIPVWLKHAWPAGKRLIIDREFDAGARTTPPTYAGDHYDGWVLGVDVT